MGMGGARTMQLSVGIGLPAQSIVQNPQMTMELYRNRQSLARLHAIGRLCLSANSLSSTRAEVTISASRLVTKEHGALPIPIMLDIGRIASGNVVYLRDCSASMKSRLVACKILATVGPCTLAATSQTLNTDSLGVLPHRLILLTVVNRKLVAMVARVFGCLIQTALYHGLRQVIVVS